MKNFGGKAQKFLVVEDEPEICKLCQRVLTVQGFEVDTAVNGKVAQDMIEQQQYDLYLIDIRMPELNGKELYQWLQDKHPKLASRVMFITGSVMGRDIQSFLEQSAKPFLLKPFTADQLEAKVREALKESGKITGEQVGV